MVEIATIIKFVDEHPGAIVELTGGEPLLQENVYPLITELVTKGIRVLIETNGSISIARVPGEVCAIIDIKCPGSGVENPILRENIAHLQKRSQNAAHSSEIKFVISDQNDYHWAKQFIHKHELTEIAPIIFSAVTSAIKPRQLAEMILADQLPVRLQVQLHTILWPGENRGV